MCSLINVIWKDRRYIQGSGQESDRKSRMQNTAIIKNGSLSKEAVRPYVKYKILNAFQNKVLSEQETDSR